jgi:hypothetical protein
MEYEIEREEDFGNQKGMRILNVIWKGQYPRNEMDYELEWEEDFGNQKGKRI